MAAKRTQVRKNGGSVCASNVTLSLFAAFLISPRPLPRKGQRESYCNAGEIKEILKNACSTPFQVGAVGQVELRFKMLGYKHGFVAVAVGRSSVHSEWQARPVICVTTENDKSPLKK